MKVSLFLSFYIFSSFSFFPISFFFYTPQVREVVSILKRSSILSFHVTGIAADIYLKLCTNIHVARYYYNETKKMNKNNCETSQRRPQNPLDFASLFYFLRFPISVCLFSICLFSISVYFLSPSVHFYLFSLSLSIFYRFTFFCFSSFSPAPFVDLSEAILWPTMSIKWKVLHYAMI